MQVIIPAPACPEPHRLDVSASSPMKVLVLHSELGVLRGGGENFTKSLFTAFAARGHRVAAAFVADRHANYPIPLPSNIEPIPIRGWWSRSLGQKTFFAIGQYSFFNGRLKLIRDRFQEAASWRVIRWHNRRFQRKVSSNWRNAWVISTRYTFMVMWIWPPRWPLTFRRF